jgi:hypothetical protein
MYTIYAHIPPLVPHGGASIKSLGGPNATELELLFGESYNFFFFFIFYIKLVQIKSLYLNTPHKNWKQKSGSF